MSLTGKPPAPGFYCPVCGDVRRVKRVSGDREVRITKDSDRVIVFPHIRGPMTPVSTRCPGGPASKSADRAP